MKRVALLSLIIALVISCVAPTGAAFALEGLEGDESGLLAPPELTEATPEQKQQSEESLKDSLNQEQELPIVPENQVLTGEPQVASLSSTTLVVVAEPEVVLPTSPLLITAYKATGAHVHAVQLYNNSSNMVSLDDARLLYVAGGNEYEIPLPSGWIEPRSYVVVAWQGESAFADIEFSFDHLTGGALESVELHHEGFQPLIVSVSPGYAGDLLHRFKSTAGNYTTNTTFAVGASTVSGGGLYTLPGMPDIAVLEVLVNPRDCTYGLETADCYDYIKVRNNSAELLDLGLYRFRSGYSNVSSSSSNTTYFDAVLAPGETATLTHDKEGKRASFTANDGTVWLEDVYGYESYDLAVPPYIDSDLTAQTGRSWAYNEETEGWQWATPSPFRVENDFTPAPQPGLGTTGQPQNLTPCRDDQYRSEETNRCRNIVTANTLKPCSEGQYRSEETNRCRSIATAAAVVLKPCADDQFRNPATNRCKTIASADDLADCGEGRERNPETNRCRNVLGVSTDTATLPFPVEETAEGAERFAGWWVIGGIATLGIGYGIWEWRAEIAGFGRRVGQFVSGKK